MKIHTFPDQKKLVREACSFIVNLAQKSAEAQGFFTFVLSGGKTPEALYKMIASASYRDKIPWENTFVFWGDERWVPRDHKESNYRLAFSTLLSKVSLSEAHIFPIPTETDVENAAKKYESMLRIFFESKNTASFDLILLGMGKDGHIASLFKNNPVLEEKECWVRAVCAPESYSVRERITITLPIINRARNVLFLITGEEKREILSYILRSKVDYPAQLVHPTGKLYLFTDIEI